MHTIKRRSNIAGTLFPELLHLHKRSVNYISEEKTPDYEFQHSYYIRLQHIPITTCYKKKKFLLAIVDAGMLGGALDFVDIIICDDFHLYLLSFDSYWYWQYVCACLNDFTYFSLLTNQYIDFDLFSLLCMRKSS